MTSTNSPSHDWLQQFYQSSNLTGQSGIAPPPESTTTQAAGHNNASPPNNNNTTNTYSFAQLGNLPGGAQASNNNNIVISDSMSSLVTTTSSSPTGRVSKPGRRRTRASRKNPTTLLNTDAKNFRAMVQRFTGGPASAPGVGGSGNMPMYSNQFTGQGQMGNFNYLQGVGVGGGGGGGGGGGSVMMSMGMGMGMDMHYPNPTVSTGADHGNHHHHQVLLPPQQYVFSNSSSSTSAEIGGVSSRGNLGRGLLSAEMEDEELAVANTTTSSLSGGPGYSAASLGGGQNQNKSGSFMF